MGSLDLAGLIGTWFSAGLALIALIGVLPVYILYKKETSKRAQAIASIDDKNYDFVTKGIPFFSGKKRYFRRVNVPDLRNPPKLEDINVLRCAKLFTRDPGARSLSGWINFANVLRAYGINFDYGGELAIVGKEAMLPVHRSWILLLGLLDRYAKGEHRPGHGLFPGEARDPQVSKRFDGTELYGLSGIMTVNPNARIEEQNADAVSICFYMHPPKHMEKLAKATGEERLAEQMAEEKLKLRTLVLLYMGYIPRPNGGVYMLHVPNSTDNYSTNDPTIQTWTIVSKKKTGYSYHDEGLLHELGIKIPDVYALEMRDSTPVDTTSYEDSAPEDRVYYTFKNASVRLHRNEAYAALHEILELGCNSQSFLFCGSQPGLMAMLFPEPLRNGNTDSQLDSMLSKARKVLRVPSLFELSLRSAARAVPNAELLRGLLPVGTPDRVLRALDNAVMVQQNGGQKCSVCREEYIEFRDHLVESIQHLEASLRNAHGTGIKWSRELWKCLWAFQTTLSKYPKADEPNMRAISVIHLLDHKFRKAMAQHRLEPSETAVVLNLAKNQIELRKATVRSETFVFNFRHFFASVGLEKPQLNGRNKEIYISPTDATLACLRSCVAIETWTRYLPSEGLAEFHAQLDPIVNVAARTTPQVLENSLRTFPKRLGDKLDRIGTAIGEFGDGLDQIQTTVERLESVVEDAVYQSRDGNQPATSTGPTTNDEVDRSEDEDQQDAPAAVRPLPSERGSDSESSVA